MVVATKAEITKRNKKQADFEKGLDANGRMADKKLCTLLRSSVRQVWMKHPVKLAYLYSKTYPDKDPNTRTKWLIDCEMCEQPKKLSEIQCDHIEGEHSLLTLEDVVPFAKSILGVCAEDLRMLCVPCHEGVTYAARYNMTLEDAFKEKVVIAKCNIPVKVQKTQLLKAGYTNKDITNADKRRECWRELLKDKQ